MTGFVVDALAGFVANVVWSVINAALPVRSQTARGLEHVRAQVHASNIFDAANAKAQALIIRATDDPRLALRLRAFLDDIEVSNFLFAQFVAPNYDISIDAKEALIAIGHRYDLHKDDVDLESILDDLTTFVGEQLHEAVSSTGSLVAHELLSQKRHVALQDAIRSLKTATSEPARVSTEEIRRFESRYKLAVRPIFGKFDLQHLENNTRPELDMLFVQPSLSVMRTDEVSDKSRKRGRFESVSLEDIYHSNQQHLVILGDAGGGKTTLAQKLCLDSLDQSIFQRRGYLPVFVTLRSLKHACELGQPDILDQIVKHHQWQCQGTQDLFRHLLLRGRMLVVFDGLDELAPAHRRQCREAIESFSRLFPASPIVVTARVRGYSQQPLDPERFQALRLDGLSEPAVEDYAHRWFELIQHQDSRARAAEFIDRSKHVAALRSNPLLLSLMCNLHAGQKQIPSNRPAVYKECTKLLLSRWDYVRGLQHDVFLQYGGHIEVVLCHLAKSIYESDAEQDGISEALAIEVMSSYLRAHYPDAVATNIAEDFLTYCGDRAWILTKSALDESGVSRVSFTHSTFLEYFAAHQYVREAQGPDDLAKSFSSKIEEGHGEIVAQLAFQIGAQRTDLAASTIIERLFIERDKTRLRKQARKRWNLFSFAVQSLQYLMPGAELVRRLVNHATSLFHRVPFGELRLSPSISGDPLIIHNQLGASEIRETCLLLNSLLDARPENAQAIATGFQDALQDLFDTEHEVLRVAAIEIGLYLPKLAERYGITEVSVAATRDIILELLEHEFFDKHRKHVEDAARQSLLAAKQLVLRKQLSAEHFVEYFGARCFFQPCRGQLHWGIHEPSLMAEIILTTDFDSITPGKPSLLGAVSALIASSVVDDDFVVEPDPVLGAQSSQERFGREAWKLQPENVGRVAWFGLAVVGLVCSEVSTYGNSPQFLLNYLKRKSLDKAERSLAELLFVALESRYLKHPSKEVRERLQHIGVRNMLEPRHAELLSAWMAGERSVWARRESA